MIRSHVRRITPAAFVGAALVIVACSGADGPGPSGPSPVPAPSQTQPVPSPPPPAPQPQPGPVPTSPPAQTTASITVRVDAGCSGRESNIAVYIDNGFLGTLQPGGSASRTVSLGDHQVMATAPSGTKWGPSTVSVGAGGWATNLTCNTSTTPPPPSQPTPTTAVLRVMVDANCNGKASNIDISIDGVYVGTTQPGGGGVSKSVSIGNHTVYGRAANGYSWGTLTKSVPAGGFTENFTCR